MKARRLAEDFEITRWPAWAADGAALYIGGAEADAQKPASRDKWETWTLDLSSGRRVRAALPPGHVMLAAHRDALLTLELKREGEDVKTRPHFVPVSATGETGEAVKALGPDRTAFYARFSPDGKTVACVVVREGGARAGKPEAVTVDVRTGVATPIKGIPDGASVGGLAWSPDGRKLSHVWFTIPQPPPDEAQELGSQNAPRLTFHVVVCDPDGANAREVHTVEAVRFYALDWR